MALEGASQAPLPELSTLCDLPDFAELAASGRQRAAFGEACARAEAALPGITPELVMGCVVRLDRGFPAVASERGTFRAEFAARLTKGRTGAGRSGAAGQTGEGSSRVAVGDWVCARVPEGHDMGLIEEILPRESDIARWRGGSRGERQTLAANVGLVIVAQALGERPISCDRIARSAVIARDCGAAFAVVLTKADRAPREVLVSDVRLVREVLGEDLRLVLTSSAAEREQGNKAGELRGLARDLEVAWGTDAVRALVPAGAVAIVLGESGAGKSTLLNALLGTDLLETGAVREVDDMGRHTTVARRMVSVPGGGVIVDEPGLRSLPLVGHERGLAMVFPHIAEAAANCRFRDCTHTHEPGCGVRAALAAGAFPEARLSCYLSLAAEMRESAGTLDPDVVL